MAEILIVDDERSMREIIRHCIGDLGHQIREAENAQAALARMAERPADVVFCDIQMPGEDGVWLTGQIRNTYHTTAVVLATAVSTLAPNTTMRAGVMAYLVKPFSRIALVDALNVALAWSDDARLRGTKPEDRGAQLDDWLDSIKDLD